VTEKKWIRDRRRHSGQDDILVVHVAFAAIDALQPSSTRRTEPTQSPLQVALIIG
jgi:hypothetical protein